MRNASSFTLAMVLCLSASGLAQAADRELAHSQKWGIRVTAVDAGAGWCGQTVALRIAAEDAAIFQTADFNRIIGAVGGRILAAECPAAKAMTLSGVTADQVVVYTGAAEAAGQWAPHAVAAAAVPAPVAQGTAPAASPTAPAPAPAAPTQGAPAVAQAPPAMSTPSPAPVVPESPILGDWVVSATCSSWGKAQTYDIVLSIDESDGRKIAGLAEIRRGEKPAKPLETLRFVTPGFLDMPTRQVSLEWDDRLYAGMNMNLPDLSGTLDPAAETITTSADYCGNGQLVFHRQSKTPETARRIKAYIAAGKAMVEQDRQRIPPGRVVGKIPGGDPKVPSCDQFLAWFNEVPVGQPIRLFSNDQTIDAHYKDEVSAPYFGSPAYVWLGAVNMKRSYRELCGKAHAGDTRSAITRLLDDYKSRRTMQERRDADVRIQTAVSAHAMTGAGPGEMYVWAASMDTPEEFAEGPAQGKSMTRADLAAGAAIAAERRDAFALAAVDEAVARMAALPASVEGANRLQALADETLALFGDSKPPQAEARLKKAAEDRKLAIAGQAADTVIAEIQGLDKTVAGLGQASDKAAEFEATFGTSPAVLKVNGASRAFRQEAAASVLAAQTAAVKALSGAQATIPAVVEIRDGVVRSLQDIDPDGVADFKVAVSAKLKDLAVAMIPDLDAKVDASAGDSVEKLGVVESIRGETARALDPEAAEPINAWATEKARALTDAYVAEVTQSMLSSGYAFDDIMRIVPAAKRVAARLKGDAYADARERIIAAAGEAAEKALEDGRDAFRVDLKGRKQDDRTVEETAEQARLFYIQARTVPAWEPYAEMALEWARDTEEELCEARLDKSGVDDDIPVLIGEQVVTTGDMVCALDGDTQITEWKTPGMFGDGIYTMKLYLEKQGFFATRRGFITLTLAEQEVRPDVYALSGKTIGNEERVDPLGLSDWESFSAQAFRRAAEKGALVAEYCPDGDLAEGVDLENVLGPVLLYCDLP